MDRNVKTFLGVEVNSTPSGDTVEKILWIKCSIKTDNINPFLWFNKVKDKITKRKTNRKK